MRFARETQTVDGWEITFTNNVHMYCHSLTVAKANAKLEIPCEDTPAGHIGVWLMDLDIESEIRNALIPVLASFFAGLGKAYKIYDPVGEVVARSCSECGKSS